MRWIHAAGRGLLVLVVILTGYVTSGARAQDGSGDGRGPLTLATAGDLTHYLGPLLQGWNRTHPGEKVTLVACIDGVKKEIECKRGEERAWRSIGTASSWESTRAPMLSSTETFGCITPAWSFGTEKHAKRSSA